ncbi:MAG TPA: sialidase family protein [Candidatus Thermoplasmatota archaeon]|nr:sialidase family protein [Candidatus Thermoplasmatota archaeon]
MLRSFPAVLLLTGLLLAGCLGGDREGREDRDGPEGHGAQGLSTHCDADRPAVAHAPDGEPRPALFTLIPCASKTGFVSREPTIGLTASGAVFHYPAMLGDNTEPTGVAVSTDRGETWTHSLPAEAGVPTHPSSLDPYLYVDPVTDRVFTDDLLNPFCSYSSWSDDEGATWDNTVAGCFEADHQTIFAGPPTVSQPDGYPNVVYRCAINAVALGGGGTMSTCQKSTDGGRVWQPFQEPAFAQDVDKLPDVCGGAHGHGIADADGTIYLPKGHCGVPMVAISDDEGASWRRVAVSTMATSSHDVGIGIDPDGRLYASWQGPDDLPYLAHSSDKGATWSEPILMAAPGVVDAGFTELYVGGVGKVVVVYYGTQQEASAPDRTYEPYLTVSYDILEADSTLYSASLTDPDVDAYVVGSCCGGVQDFIDVRIGPDGTPWAALIDDCLGDGGRTCSTREVAPGVEEQLDTQREGVAGWLEGGPSLWDDADTNGPYP